MQTLQKTKSTKTVCLIAALLMTGVIITLLYFAQETSQNNTPESNMPIPGSAVPDTTVSNDPPTMGMPVPGNTVPEMIVRPN